MDKTSLALGSSPLCEESYLTLDECRLFLALIRTIFLNTPPLVEFSIEPTRKDCFEVFVSWPVQDTCDNESKFVKWLEQELPQHWEDKTPKYWNGTLVDQGKESDGPDISIDDSIGR